jgi:hypothetical protein
MKIENRLEWNEGIFLNKVEDVGDENNKRIH